MSEKQALLFSIVIGLHNVDLVGVQIKKNSVADFEAAESRWRGCSIA
jgi:hypothetical protein